MCVSSISINQLVLPYTKRQLTSMPLQSALVKIGFLITCLLCVVGSIQQTISISCGNISYHCNSTKDGCISLDDVADKLDNLLPNCVLELTSGTCNLTHPLIFTQVNNITIRGQGSYHTTIYCHHMNAGLVFNDSSNIELENFTIDSCGVSTSISSEEFNLLGNASKSIIITSTSTILLQRLVIANSHGYGLMIKDSFTRVLLNTIFFHGNKLRTGAELHNTQGGGGLAVVFMSQLKHKDATTRSSKYNIINCTFEDNYANFNFSHVLDQETTDRGGGMRLYLIEQSQDIEIKIDSCFFKNNKASYGGGLFAWFSANSTNCHLTVYETVFTENTAVKKSGGGVHVGYTIGQHQETPTGNSMLFDSVNFTANDANSGGGASLFISSVSTVSTLERQDNNITFRKCKFINNLAAIGAMEVKPDYLSQLGSRFIAQVVLCDCVFTNNSRKSSIIRKPTSTLLTSRIPISFSKTLEFHNNQATGIFASSALLIFQENSNVTLLGNVGDHGGGIFLSVESKMVVYNNSVIKFINNTASYGGAICSMTRGIYGVAYIGSCFVQPKGVNITFYFNGNKALRHIGNNIFASSLQACFASCKHRSHNITVRKYKDIFSSCCIGKFIFIKTGMLGCSISTSPKTLITSASFLNLIPGLPYHLKITQTDELDQSTDLFFLTVEVKGGLEGQVSAHAGYTPVVNGTIEVYVYGKPGVNGTIVLENNAPVVRNKGINFSLAQCPPGFSLNNDKLCICAANTELSYFQMPLCREDAALIINGFWAGYIGKMSEETLFVGACTSFFCYYKSNFTVDDGFIKFPISVNSKEKLENIVCTKHRKGILCGSCIEGYSAFYHSPKIRCYETTSKCSYGIPLYIISELVPVTIVFLFILLLNIRLTSGALYSFVFYAQVIDFLYIDGFELLTIANKPLKVLSTLIHPLYSMFNLKVFMIDSLSFCLISNANAMDLYMFQYGTILYSVLLVVVTVLVLRLHSCYSCVKLCRRCGRRNIRGSIVDGMSAFLVLCYFQCSLITFYILTPVTLRGRGEVYNQTVPLFHGNTEYFGSGHLPYAIPAIVCLIVMMIPPPCVLLLEPITTKLFSLAMWPRSIKVTYNRFRMKLMPFLDSFQGSFKDKYRFFSGLYFAYRLLIPLMYVVYRNTVSSCYTAVEITLFLIVLLHVLFRPYKVLWHNFLESAIFMNLLFINTITIFHYGGKIWGNNDTSREVGKLVWLQILAVLMPLVYLVAYITARVYHHIKLFCASRRKDATTTRTPQTNIDDSMGFPARLLESKADYNTF